MSNDELILPVDVRPPWVNILRCLQSHSRKQCGVAMLEIKIIVEGDLPKFWSTPKMTTFEPKGNADQIIEFLKGMINQ